MEGTQVTLLLATDLVYYVHLLSTCTFSGSVTSYTIIQIFALKDLLHKNGAL
jgi:hypothetical protein